MGESGSSGEAGATGGSGETSGGAETSGGQESIGESAAEVGGGSEAETVVGEPGENGPAEAGAGESAGDTGSQLQGRAAAEAGADGDTGDGGGGDAVASGAEPGENGPVEAGAGESAGDTGSQLQGRAAAEAEADGEELITAQLKHNEDWINRMREEGRLVIDTGPAEQRSSYPAPTRPSHWPQGSYEVELSAIDNYPNVIQPWENMTDTTNFPWKYDPSTYADADGYYKPEQDRAAGAANSQTATGPDATGSDKMSSGDASADRRLPDSVNIPPGPGQDNFDSADTTEVQVPARADTGGEAQQLVEGTARWQIAKSLSQDNSGTNATAEQSQDRVFSDDQLRTAAERANRDRSAVERLEWQAPLARGEVDRVGLGVIDERAKSFSPSERRIADYLATPGSAVVAVSEMYGREGRKPDACVDDIPVEFKSLDPGANDRTVKAALNSAKGQASHTVIDGRGSGLTQDDANRGLQRFLGTPWAYRLESVRIIGDGYDLQWKRGI
jgi:hypothetical protein